MQHSFENLKYVLRMPHTDNGIWENITFKFNLFSLVERANVLPPSWFSFLRVVSSLYYFPFACIETILFKIRLFTVIIIMMWKSLQRCIRAISVDLNKVMANAHNVSETNVLQCAMENSSCVVLVHDIFH